MNILKTFFRNEIYCCEMKQKNNSSRGYWLIVGSILCLMCPWTSAQDCSSPTLTFAGQFPTVPEISTTVGAGYTLAEHTVWNVRTVTVRPTVLGLPVYIVATLTNEKLTITTNDQFTEFEKLDNKLLFLNVVAFNCSSGTIREMTFRQSIKEENKFAPIFSRDEYAITVPLPLPKDFNIRQFVDDGKGILANDYDITKNMITFSLEENQYFSVRSSRGLSRPEYLADLVTRQTLTKFQSPLTFQIIAIDAWDPPRKSQAKLTISADPVITFVAPPEFVQSIYHATYMLGQAFTPVIVSLTKDTYDSTVQFELSGDDSGFFIVSTSPNDGKASIAFRSGSLVENGKTIFSATVMATRRGTDSIGRTALVVEITNNPKPIFERNLYTGTISKGGTIMLDTAIKLTMTTETNGVHVKLTGKNAKYFVATMDNYQVDIVPSLLLTDATLREKSFFLLELQVEYGSERISETVLVLSNEIVSLNAPHFEQTVYEGTVTETGSLIMPTVKIFADSYTDGLTFNYSGDVSFFMFNSGAFGIISIFPNNITSETLTNKTYLLVNISGMLGGVETTHAVIILRILRAPTILPRFTHIYLEGQLMERTLELHVPNVELVASTFIAGKTKIRLIDELEFFDLQEYFPENIFQVYLRSTVTYETLRGIDSIILTVQATNPSSDMVYCVINVKISRTPTPVFEHFIYYGVIDDTKQLIEPLTAKLAAESTYETVQYSLEGMDASYFLLELIAFPFKGVKVILAASLSDSEFERRDHFQLTLRATVQQTTSDAIVPIVVYVKHPPVKIPKFKKPLYKTRVTTQLQLIPFEDINLEHGSYLDSAVVSIRDNNTDLFHVSLLEGVVTISLLKKLDQITVNKVDRFELIVECSNPGMGSGFTTVLVEIERFLDPEFSELIYSGQVESGAKDITFESKITMKATSANSNIIYSLQGVDSALVRFVVHESDQSLSLFLRDEITTEQLKGKSVLGFALVAFNPQGQSAVASCLVKIIRAVKTTFTQSSFHGRIVEGQTLVDFGTTPIAWEKGTITETTMFSIVANTPYVFFEAKLEDDRMSLAVQLRALVTWDQVRSHFYFMFFIQATNTGAEPSQCLIVVDVVNQPVITPIFTKSIYRGLLQQGTKEVVFSQADTITVEANTITATFQYTSSEGDASLFDVTLSDENKMKVSLKTEIETTNIEGRDVLSFLININNAYSAVDTATVVIMVKLDDIISPSFRKLLYTGRIVENTNVLLLEDSILLDTGTYNENTELSIGGPHARLFSIKRNESMIELKPLDWRKLVSTANYLSIYIQATNPGSYTTTAFVVISIEPIRVPQFAKAALHGSVDIISGDVLFMERSELRIISASTAPGFQWNLAGDDHELFEGALNDDLFKFSLKKIITSEDLGSRSVFYFNVTLQNPGSGTVESQIVVNRKLPKPLFTKAVYEGSFDQELNLMLSEEVQLIESTYLSDTVISVSSMNVNFLSVEQNGPIVQLKLSRSITLVDLQGRNMLYLLLDATNGNGIQSTCAVLLHVPYETPCIPLPSIVECTSCYNYTSGSVQKDVPVFMYGNYRYQLRSDTSGPIGSVTATSKDPMATVKHELEVTNDYLRTFITITPEGEISLLKPLIPNIYTFLVHATNKASRKMSTASVLLNVLNAYECADGVKKFTVEQSFLVLHLVEEKPHSTIFPSRLGTSCVYELLSETPVSAAGLQTYFFIDSETGWLSARSIDREDKKLFGELGVPQFQLTMKLQCHNDKDKNRKNNTFATRTLVKRSMVDVNAINYSPDITIVSIIVDDINDNDPFFIQPFITASKAGGVVHLGYPEPYLASRLMLPYLIVVKATDADEGYNAQIRYSLARASGHFDIHPMDGSIHPTQDALREINGIEFWVIASDRDGDVDGRKAYLSLNVHRLDEDQIAIVTLVLDSQVTVEDIMTQMNQETFQIKLLHHAYVPTDKAKRPIERQSQSIQRTLRLVVYALDANNQPMNTDSIRSGIMKAIPSINASTIASFVKVVCHETEIDTNLPCSQGLSTKNAGFIASISVLGALLLIILLVGSVMYLRYMRPILKQSCDSSDIVQLENDFDTSSPSTQSTKRELLPEDMLNDIKRSINISGLTTQESEDINAENKWFNINDRPVEDVIERNEQSVTCDGKTQLNTTMSESKNVKFNEIVERIEVQEQHSENDEDDGEDESICEERL